MKSLPAMFRLGRSWPGALIAVAVFIALDGWLWWACRQNAETHFLPKRGPAEWIVYPNPPDAGLHRIAESSAEFRRDFVIEGAPAHCVLSVCAFRSFTVSLNGALLSIPPAHSANWKEPTIFQLDGLLREGQN